MQVTLCQAQHIISLIRARQWCLTDQVLDVRQNHTRLLAPWSSVRQPTSKCAVALVVSKSVRNRHNNGTRSRVRALDIRCVSSRFENFSKTVQQNARLETNCDRRNPTFMIDDLTISLRRTFKYRFVCQTVQLRCAPAIEEERTFEFKAGPVGLWPTTKRVLCHPRVTLLLKKD